ncbi:hypothetical protein BVX93_00310 [bacterium B13(2017)]|nr:hypothetical protein BVX93_00310 [bacterium B13(2017)]
MLKISYKFFYRVLIILFAVCLLFILTKDGKSSKKNIHPISNSLRCSNCEFLNNNLDEYCINCSQKMHDSINDDPSSLHKQSIENKDEFPKRKCFFCSYENNIQDRICINCLKEIVKLTENERKQLRKDNIKKLNVRRKKVDSQIQKSLPFIKMRNIFASYRPLLEKLSELDESIPIKEEHIIKLINEINKVFDFKIYYKLGEDFTLPKVLVKKYNATSERVEFRRIVRIFTILDEFFSAYPKELIRNKIKKIYLVQNYKEKRGSLLGVALSHEKSFLINCKANTYSLRKSDYLLTFHHEFNHLIYYSESSSFGKKDWLKMNPQDFSYQKEAWKNYSITSQEKLNEMGFIRKYGVSALVEDIATFSETLFCRTEKLIKLCKKHKAIKRKTMHLIEWYEKLGVEFKFTNDTWI